MPKKKEVLTADEKLEELRQFLIEEIIRSEEVLADPFLRTNLYAMELGIHAEKISYYKQVLEKLESL
jgi:hypothetical protein